MEWMVAKRPLLLVYVMEAHKGLGDLTVKHSHWHAGMKLNGGVMRTIFSTQTATNLDGTNSCTSCYH